jgi:4-hydroxybenzoate polyprenyltransferase
LIVGVYLSFVKLKPLYSLYFIFTAFALYFYSKHLKTKLLVGNILVSTLCCITILIIIDFEYSYQLNNSQDFFSIKVDIIYGFILTIFSFITTFIREIIKDIEDINGDLKIKAKTLPIVIGIKRASKVAFFFSSILFLLLLILLQSIKSEILFLGYGIIFILFPLINFLYKLWFAKSKKDFSKLSKLMKVIMLLGILSMLLFRLIDV